MSAAENLSPAPDIEGGFRYGARVTFAGGHGNSPTEIGGDIGLPVHVPAPAPDSEVELLDRAGVVNAGGHGNGTAQVGGGVASAVDVVAPALNSGRRLSRGRDPQKDSGDGGE